MQIPSRHVPLVVAIANALLFIGAGLFVAWFYYLGWAQSIMPDIRALGGGAVAWAIGGMLTGTWSKERWTVNAPAWGVAAGAGGIAAWQWGFDFPMAAGVLSHDDPAFWLGIALIAMMAGTGGLFCAEIGRWFVSRLQRR